WPRRYVAAPSSASRSSAPGFRSVVATVRSSAASVGGSASVLRERRLSAAGFGPDATGRRDWSRLADRHVVVVFRARVSARRFSGGGRGWSVVLVAPAVVPSAVDPAVGLHGLAVL